MPTGSVEDPLDLPLLVVGVDRSDVLAQVHASSELVEWIDLVSDTGAATDLDVPCHELIYYPLSTDAFGAVAVLDDGVLAELILNADASLSAATLACKSDEPQRTRVEVEAARSSVELMRHRLSELEGGR